MLATMLIRSWYSVVGVAWCGLSSHDEALPCWLVGDRDILTIWVRLESEVRTDLMTHSRSGKTFLRCIRRLCSERHGKMFSAVTHHLSASAWVEMTLSWLPFLTRFWFRRSDYLTWFLSSMFNCLSELGVQSLIVCLLMRDDEIWTVWQMARGVYSGNADVSG